MLGVRTPPKKEITMPHKYAQHLTRHQVRLKSVGQDFQAIEFELDDNGGTANFLKALHQVAPIQSHISIGQATDGDGVGHIKFKYNNQEYVLVPGDLLMYRNYHDGNPIELQVMPSHIYNRWFEKIKDDGSNLNRVNL